MLGTLWPRFDGTSPMSKRSRGCSPGPELSSEDLTQEHLVQNRIFVVLLVQIWLSRKALSCDQLFMNSQLDSCFWF